MPKNIKDYLHLYLGCEIVASSGKTLKLMTAGQTGYYATDGYNNVSGSSDLCKPILRPLSDMTEEEKNEFIDICGLEPEDISCLERTRDEFFPEPETSYGTAHLTNIAQWAVGVHYLLSKHFDLFQLIESGLAIDKTKNDNG